MLGEHTYRHAYSAYLPIHWSAMIWHIMPLHILFSFRQADKSVSEHFTINWSYEVCLHAAWKINGGFINFPGTFTHFGCPLSWSLRLFVRCSQIVWCLTTTGINSLCFWMKLHWKKKSSAVIPLKNRQRYISIEKSLQEELLRIILLLRNYYKLSQPLFSTFIELNCVNAANAALHERLL